MTYRKSWWALGTAALVGGYAFARRTRGYEHVAEELQSPLSRFRTPSFGPVLVSIIQALPVISTKIVDGVDVELHHTVGADGTTVPLYVYRPHDVKAGTAAMIFTHGGGLVSGSAPSYHSKASAYCRDLGMVVVSPDYRLAPRHPFPAPLDDVYAAYRWLVTEAGQLGVDRDRIVVAGDSAGGGLTAALCHRIRDAGDPAPALQLLIYPMLDDRSADSPIDERGQVVWTRQSNAFGWTSYLGHPTSAPTTQTYAVPARETDLSGLPPAWIGVGTLDLFHDEDVDYARRLRDAGVACELVLVEGAFHGFDVIHPDTVIARAFRKSALDAVQRATAAIP